MPPEKTFKLALDAVQQGKQAVLVAVVDCSGSVPGKTGAKMVVSDLGCAGTVGGGIAETLLTERARAHAGEPELYRFHHTPQTDSLCAGTQTFALLPLEERHEQVLATIVSTLEGDDIGLLRLSASGISFTSGTRSPRSFGGGDSGWHYRETLGRLDTLYLIGGGHVSLALSRIMATLPFRIVVLDDREQLPTMLENSWAHETRVIAYERVAEEIPQGDLTWVVIMTHGHRNDQQVLGQLVEKRSYRYLGMMGSPVKIAQIYANLKEQGIPRQALERVRAPVGIDIGSHTPEEIAISIAAEIVKLRSE